MRVPIQHVLPLVFISEILSSSDEKFSYIYRTHNVCYKGNDYKFICIQQDDHAGYNNWWSSRQKIIWIDTLQYYISCAEVHSIESPKEIYSFEYAKNCPIPNLSFAEILNAVVNQELVNEIRLKSFSSNDTVLQSYHFENFTSLRRLYIEGNLTNIDELPHDIFKKISVLEELSLNNVGITVQLLKPLARLIAKLELIFNNLTTLNDNIFLNFSEMKHLTIKGNNLHTISKYVFDSTLTKLIQLDLIDNNIEYLEDEVFGKLGSLKYLNLSYNSLTKLPNKLFAGAVKLVKISIDANKLEELPADLFQYCQNITFISLKNNSLERITPFIFDSNYDLEELDISGNQLQEVHEIFYLYSTSWLSKLQKLRKLRLSRNHLKYLFNFRGIDEYSNLQSLVELDVSHNDLKSIFREDWGFFQFSIMENVEEINFRNNSLNESTHIIHSKWNKLKTVDLSYNQFNSIFMKYFISTSKTRTTFNFTNNPIRNLKFNEVEEELQDCHERSSCGIITIIVGYNSIECNCNVFDWAKYIQGKSHLFVKNYVHYQSLNQPTCQWSNSNKTILLSDLNLQEIICPAVLQEDGLLEIDYEQIVDFDFKKFLEKCVYWYRPANESIIVNCSKQTYNLQLLLKQIDLITETIKSVELILTNNNNISLREISNLSSIPSLIKLSLSSNSLKNVDELFIPNSLGILELDNNEISHLNDAVICRINESDKLTSITLHNNPWECSCKTEKMVRFFQDIRKKIMYPDNVVCNETGDSIFFVSTKYLCQGFLDKYLPFIIALILLALALAVTLIIHLSYIYKNEIKVWMFANKYLSWLVTEEEIDKDKQYDAFISFSSKDVCFVKSELVPKLEESNEHPPLKLCVHYRDFIVGEHIHTQIDHFVKNSRRTVILLSSNFLESEWAKIEFSTAHLESIRENRPKVITILLEEINEEDLDVDLRKYISSYTYLKWGEPRFWERLRFALPHPQPTVVSTDLRPV